MRVKALQLMGHEDPTKRENFLIKAFLKGMKDQKLAAATQMVEPDTLGEAIDIAKREKRNIETNRNRTASEGVVVIGKDDGEKKYRDQPEQDC